MEGAYVVGEGASWVEGAMEGACVVGEEASSVEEAVEVAYIVEEVVCYRQWERCSTLSPNQPER